MTVLLAILLLFIAFVIGYFVGHYLHDNRSKTDAAAPTDYKSVAVETPKPASSAPAAVAPKPAVKPMPEKPAEAAIAKPAPAAVVEKPKIEETKPVVATLAATPPAPAAEKQSATTSGNAAGTRPVGLSEPKVGGPDKLTRVKGIGPVNEKRLHGLGIFHFEQIAAWGEGEIAWVDEHLSFKGRIERENWVGQAGDFAKETN